MRVSSSFSAIVVRWSVSTRSMTVSVSDSASVSSWYELPLCASNANQTPPGSLTVPVTGAASTTTVTKPAPGGGGGVAAPQRYCASKPSAPTLESDVKLMVIDAPGLEKVVWGSSRILPVKDAVH